MQTCISNIQNVFKLTPFKIMYKVISSFLGGWELVELRSFEIVTNAQSLTVFIGFEKKHVPLSHSRVLFQEPFFCQPCMFSLSLHQKCYRCSYSVRQSEDLQVNQINVPWTWIFLYWWPAQCLPCSSPSMWWERREPPNPETDMWVIKSRRVWLLWSQDKFFMKHVAVIVWPW